jgi:hypothetical protein
LFVSPAPNAGNADAPERGSLRRRRVPPVPRTWGPGNPYKSPPSNSTVIQRSAVTKNLQLFSAAPPPTAFRKLVKTLASSVTPRNSVQPISDLHISLHTIFCANIAGYFFDRRILVLKLGIERHRAADRLRRVRILRPSIAEAVKSVAEALCGDNFVANRYIQANLQRPIRRTDGISRSCMKNTGRVRKNEACDFTRSCDHTRACDFSRACSFARAGGAVFTSPALQRGEHGPQLMEESR